MWRFKSLNTVTCGEAMFEKEINFLKCCNKRSNAPIFPSPDNAVKLTNMFCKIFQKATTKIKSSYKMFVRLYPGREARKDTWCECRIIFPSQYLFSVSNIFYGRSFLGSVAKLCFKNYVLPKEYKL